MVEKPQPRLYFFKRTQTHTFAPRKGLLAIAVAQHRMGPVGTQGAEGCVVLPGLSSSAPTRTAAQENQTANTHIHSVATSRQRYLEVCRDPQVILRPSLSTRGRSNRQRLFLGYPELFCDACLGHPIHKRAAPRGRQRRTAI